RRRPELRAVRWFRRVDVPGAGMPRQNQPGSHRRTGRPPASGVRHARPATEAVLATKPPTGAWPTTGAWPRTPPGPATPARPTRSRLAPAPWAHRPATVPGQRKPVTPAHGLAPAHGAGAGAATGPGTAPAHGAAAARAAIRAMPRTAAAGVAAARPSGAAHGAGPARTKKLVAAARDKSAVPWYERARRSHSAPGQRHCGLLEKILHRQWALDELPPPQIVLAVDRLAEFPQLIKERLVAGLDAIYVGPGGGPNLDDLGALSGLPLPSLPPPSDASP